MMRSGDGKIRHGWKAWHCTIDIVMLKRRWRRTWATEERDGGGDREYSTAL